MKASLTALLCLFAIITPGPCNAQVSGIPSTCLFDDYPDPSTCTTPCGPGCAGDLPVIHAGAGTPEGGGFAFAFTEFGTCGHATPCSPVPYPMVRIWEWNNFMGANNGCEPQDRAGGEWLVNALIDEGLPSSDPGIWVSRGSTFRGDRIDGCPFTTAPADPVVVEISFVDSRAEGTAQHKGYFVVASVPLDGGVYNLDEVAGGMGANGNLLPVVEIPRPISPVPWWSGPNAVDPHYLDLEITMPSVDYLNLSYQEAGSSRTIVDGACLRFSCPDHQPTSSRPDYYDGWAADPSDPDDTVPYVIPWGATSTVAIRDSPTQFSTSYHLVALLHYADASVQPPDALVSWATSGHVTVPGTTYTWIYRGESKDDLTFYAEADWPSWTDPEPVLADGYPSLLFYRVRGSFFSPAYVVKSYPSVSIRDF